MEHGNQVLLCPMKAKVLVCSCKSILICKMNAFQDILLRAIPEDWQKLSGVPFAEVATHVGRVALAFVDPVVVLAATVWGVTRGSDAVSGQLERGTMEMLLAQPVRRRSRFIESHDSRRTTAAIASQAHAAAALINSVFYNRQPRRNFSGSLCSDRGK